MGEICAEYECEYECKFEREYWCEYECENGYENERVNISVNAIMIFKNSRSLTKRSFAPSGDDTAFINKVTVFYGSQVNWCEIGGEGDRRETNYSYVIGNSNSVCIVLRMLYNSKCNIFMNAFFMELFVHACIYRTVLEKRFSCRFSSLVANSDTYNVLQACKLSGFEIKISHGHIMDI